MKKSLLFISALIAGASAVAQSVIVPNGGFESWTGTSLVSWSDSMTVNATANGNPQAPSTYRIADSVVVNPNTGTKSIVVRSNSNTGFVGFGGPVINVAGIMVSGEAASVNIKTALSYTVGPPFKVESAATPTVSMTGKIPFAGATAPIGLKGYYKYKSDSTIQGSINLLLFANGGDTVAAYADLTKLGAATTNTDTLDALVYTFAKTNTWTSFSFNLSANLLGGYTSIPSTIDSARIVAITCTPSQLIAGKSSAADSLFLDGLEFVYPSVTGIESLTSANFSVSQNAPNPFDGTTTITFSAAAAADVTFTVVDLLGRIVKEQTINASAGTNTITYSAGTSAPGTYFYTISDGTNTVTKKLVVSK